MKKEDELIMVIERSKLFLEDGFQGFLKAEKTDFYSRILDNFSYIRRGDAEINPEYKQPIGYVVFVNKKEKTVFLYKRAVKDKNYTEKRLQGMWSWGVGGHIDKIDSEDKDPIKKSVLREVDEEVKLIGKINGMDVLGYINDDSNEVGKVHFGVLFLADIEGEVVIKNQEMLKSKMASLNYLKKVVEKEKVEDWSKISLPVIEKIIS